MYILNNIQFNKHYNMINQQTLELYVYIDGINDVPFWSYNYQDFVLANGEQFVTSDGKVFNVRILNENIIIHAFTYNAQRMGAAPTITTTIKYSECLDELFSEKVYAIFNGEKYFLVATPSSSYSNDEIMYKHEATFVSERIVLENTYFYDVVTENTEVDKPVSNNSEFSFFGNISQFKDRMNQSLERSGLEYRVTIDEGIASEEKLISIENKFFSEVLQEVYDTYELPYYFVGKTIHIGYTTNSISKVFKYGDRNALVSINKANANQRTINRVTGMGSEDNIPYYYPNISPEGDIRVKLAETNTGITNDNDIAIIDYEKFAKNIIMGQDAECFATTSVTQTPFEFYGWFQDRVNREIITRPNTLKNIVTTTAKGENELYQISYNITNVDKVNDWGYWDDPEEPQAFSWKSLGDIRPLGFIPTIKVISCKGDESNLAKFEVKGLRVYWILKDYYLDDTDEELGSSWSFDESSKIEIAKDEEYGYYQFPNFNEALDFDPEEMYSGLEGMGASVIKIEWDILAPNVEYELEVGFDTYNLNSKIWKVDGNVVGLDKIGLKLNKEPEIGDKFQKFLVEGSYIQPQKHLMPPIYRESLGDERFYNAISEIYPIPNEDGLDSGLVYTFDNEYDGHNPKEQIVQFEEIKPTIKEAINKEGLRIDMFSDFAYDEDDNDETFENDEGVVKYKHPYFFAKLRKLDFNLFDHAIDDGEMTIAMTDGHCGGCEFRVAVDKEDGKSNLVQVDAYGNLIYENGYVLCGAEDYQDKVSAQPQQQDTVNNEVWIALYKDTETFGKIMPSKRESGEIRPKACTKSTSNDGDTFVILHINLPQMYIDAAEEKLRQQLIQYMWDNNSEKFSFSVKFSRIFFAENEENEHILRMLDENSRITIEYNDQQYTLYVSSLTYKATENEILPEITVELKDELAVSKNSIQKATAQVKAELYKMLYGIDVVAQGSQVFLRKDQPDTVNAPITFDAKPILNEGATLDKQMNSKDYFEGAKGLGIRKDKNNNWHIEADYLHVRKKFSAKEVEIQKMYHIGGAQIKSSASMVCSRVVEYEDSYRCYFNTYDDNDNTIYNEFMVGDQAYVQTFNLIDDSNGNTTNHFYWRLVTAVDANSITLSKTTCAEGSTEPMVGDNIVQLGYQGNDRPERQVVVIDAGAGEGAPYYRQFVGINSFEWPDAETQLKPGDNRLTGKVDIKDGSLLTGTIVVKDDHNYPTVMINGSDTLSNNGRKIVIAAGVNDYDEHPNGEISWVDSKTTIYDDGTINVGGQVGLSAIENTGEEKVRIWAGATESNKHNAPFRVLQDGRVIATEAHIAGTVNAKSGTFENGTFNNVTLKGSVSNPVVAFRGTTITVWDSINEEHVNFTRKPESDYPTKSLYAWIDENETTIYTKTIDVNIGFDTFYDAKLSGSVVIRKYQYSVTDTSNPLLGKDNIDKHDNLAILVNSDKRHFAADELSWEVSNSGRLIRLINAPYDGFESSGYAKLYAPSGKYFFEDGEQYSNIIFSNQIVELFGYGTKDEFYGWIVTNRKDVSTKNSYGTSPKVLYQGVIRNSKIEKLWTPELNYSNQVTSLLVSYESATGVVVLPKLNYRGLSDISNWEVIVSNAVVKAKSYDADNGTIRFQIGVLSGADNVVFQVISTADWATLGTTTNE